MTAETLTVNLPPPSGRKGRRVTEPSGMAHWNDGVDLTMQNPEGWHGIEFSWEFLYGMAYYSFHKQTIHMFMIYRSWGWWIFLLCSEIIVSRSRI